MENKKMKLEVWQSIMHKPEKFFPIIQTGGLAVDNTLKTGVWTEIWLLIMPKPEKFLLSLSHMKL